MADAEALLLEYWDDLPRDLRVELLLDSGNNRTVVNRAAQELDLDFSIPDQSGHLSSEDLARFVIAVMEKYEGGPVGVDG